jgi:hypothetical protein
MGSSGVEQCRAGRRDRHSHRHRHCPSGLPKIRGAGYPQLSGVVLEVIGVLEAPVRGFAEREIIHVE